MTILNPNPMIAPKLETRTIDRSSGALETARMELSSSDFAGATDEWWKRAKTLIDARGENYRPFVESYVILRAWRARGPGEFLVMNGYSPVVDEAVKALDEAPAVWFDGAILQDDTLDIGERAVDSRYGKAASGPIPALVVKVIQGSTPRSNHMWGVTAFCLVAPVPLEDLSRYREALAQPMIAVNRGDGGRLEIPA